MPEISVTNTFYFGVGFGLNELVLIKELIVFLDIGLKIDDSGLELGNYFSFSHGFKKRIKL